MKDMMNKRKEKNDAQRITGYGDIGAQLLIAKFVDENWDGFSAWLCTQGRGESSGCARWLR